MAYDVRTRVGPIGTGEPNPALRVIVLGVLAVELEGRPLHVAGSHRRRLLALLATRPGRAVPVDAIVDALWGEEPPPTAAKTIQSHVMRLRRSLAELGTDVLETVPVGYRLNVDPTAVDAVQFEQLVAEGRCQLQHGDEGAAVAVLGDALALWRGPAYAEFQQTEFAVAENARLNELRLTAMEDLAEARLSTGAVATAVPELERLVVEEPGRERAWALLMRALYAAGRQQHALAAYRRARHALADEFGLEPGVALRELERRVLGQDPTLAVAGERSLLPPALRAATPFVGRTAELAALQETWTTAVRGGGRIYVLFGPVDSGRTRLVGELAAGIVELGGWVDYVRGADGFDRLVASTAGGAPAPGAVVDAVADRCRRGPLLLVVDDAEWLSPTAVATLESLAIAAVQLTILVVVIADPAGGGPAIEALRRLPDTVTATVAPASDVDLAEIVAADGVRGDAVGAIVAVAGGLPGVARREAAVWAERAASDRLQEATVSAIGAVAAADSARASVFDDVLQLVAARARRNELVSSAWVGRQPYRALASYGPEDADLFVGRERLVAELAARVLDRRLVAVVGASGSGKSSLVRAGLVPLVHSGRLPGAGQWRTHVVAPGPDPIGALDAVGELDEPGPQLLVVDQFEELFATGAADAFAGRLVDLVLDAALDVHVVVVVRADQYAMLAATRRLAELVDEAQVLVGPPTDDELRRIIEVPARRTGCAVEPALVTLITEDVAGHDALPLVSAALAEVWERRDDDTLRAERYMEIGGIAAAVARLGARAIARAGNDVGIREVMLHLVDVTDDGEWVRRQISAGDLPKELAPALDALVDERLVVRDDETVDVVHEVVFRAWPQLETWLEEARADLVLDRELRAAARTWDTEGRSEDDVWRGARLAGAAELATRRADLPPVVSDFVAAGQQVAEREHEQVRAQLTREVRNRRRLGRALAAAAVLLVIALVGGVLALVAQRRADDERGRAAAAAALAEESAAREQVGRLVAQSGRLLDSQLDRALLLAAEANRRDDNPETRGALLTALNPNPASERAFLGFLTGPKGAQFDVDTSDDGRIVASAGFAGPTPPDGMVIVYDTMSRAELGRMKAGTAFIAVDVSGDGRHVLAHSHFEVHLFDVTTGTAAKLPVPPPGAADLAAVDRGDTSIARAVLRPDRDQFVVVTSDGVMTLFDIDGSPVDAILPDGPAGYIGWRRSAALGFVDFEPGGRLRIVQRGENGMSVVFWDIDRGEAVRTVPLENPGPPIGMFAASADGALLAGQVPEGPLFVWDLATGALRGDPADRPPQVRGIAFHPTAPSMLAIGVPAGGVTLYDLSTERRVGEPLQGQGLTGESVAFAADGSRLFTIGGTGLVGIWGESGASGLVNELLARGVSGPEPSANGSRLLVTVDATRLEVRDGADPSRPGVEIAPPGGGQALVEPQTYDLSADGSTVVAFVGGDAPAVFVGDAESGETLWSSSDLEDLDPPAASLSADGSRVIVVDRSWSRLRMWDVDTGELAGQVTVADLDSTAPFNGRPQFSPDGTSVDVVTLSSVARLSATDLRPVRVVAAPFQLQGDVSHVPGTDDVIASAGAGQIARLDMAGGEVVATGQSPDSSGLFNVAVSPDGSLVVAGHPFSFRLAVFDAATLRPIGEPFRVGDLLFGPQFTPDGLLGNGRSNDLTRWDMDPGSWRDAACRAAGRNLTQEEWAQYIGADEPYRSTCP